MELALVELISVALVRARKRLSFLYLELSVSFVRGVVSPFIGQIM